MGDDHVWSRGEKHAKRAIAIGRRLQWGPSDPVVFFPPRPKEN